MGNCLKTQLKEVVNNPNLLRLGEIQLLTITEDTAIKSFIIGSEGDEDIVVSCDSNGLFDNNQREITLVGGSGTVTLSSITGSTVIKVMPYYNINQINSGSSASQNTNYQYIYDESIFGKLPYLKTLGIRYLSDISVLEPCENMENLYLNNSSVTTGNLSSLYNMKKLTKVVFRSSTNKITGSLEGLANAQVSAPNARTSGSLAVECNGKITLNGEAVSAGTTKTINFGTSMVDPTEQETTQGWQIV